MNSFIRNRKTFTTLLENPAMNSSKTLLNNVLTFTPVVGMFSILSGGIIYIIDLKVNPEIKLLNAKIDNNHKLVDEKFKHMDEKIDEKFKHMDEKIDEKFKHMDEKLDNILKIIQKR